jgi:hypothetical protein
VVEAPRTLPGEQVSTDCSLTLVSPRRYTTYLNWREHPLTGDARAGRQEEPVCGRV